MTLARTFSINVRRILSRRRGQYDLEDEFLWFNKYLQQDPSWRSVPYGSLATLSDDPQYSRISLDCPNIELFNEKQNFVRICRGESWMPRSVVLHIDEDGYLTGGSIANIRTMEDFPLLFLKKAGPGIGGGYDVTPIVSREDKLREQVEQAIIKQNENRRYRRDVFVLQAGIENPLLTSLGQKTDLRLYMLIVGSPDGRQAFYACRVGDIRNTARYPYYPFSEDPRLQITNVAQNRNLASSTQDITRIFSRDSTSMYDRIFEHFLYIVKRIGKLYGRLISSPDRHPGVAYVTLIGLDAVVDSRTMRPMIVEMNRRPTVYTPEEAEEMQYSSTLFMQDVFELGVQAIADDTVGLKPEDNSQFVLVRI